MKREENGGKDAGGMIAAAAAVVSAVYLPLAAFFPGYINHTPEYAWPVLHHGSWERLPGALLIMGICAVLFLALAAKASVTVYGHLGRTRMYLALFLLGFACQLGPAAVHKNGLLELPIRVYLPDHTSYFTDAAGIENAGTWIEDFDKRFNSIDDLLSDVRREISRNGPQADLGKQWAEAAKIYQTHTRTHPPGAVLFFYVINKAAENLPGLTNAYFSLVPRSDEAMRHFGITRPQAAAGGIAALILLLAAAGVAPVAFALARFGMDDGRAVMAAALVCLSPAFAFKTPVLDHLFGLMILGCALITVSGVRRRRIDMVALAGFLAGLGLWMGTALLAAFPLCLLLSAAALRSFKEEKAPLKNHFVLLACFACLLAVSAAVAVWAVQGIVGASYLDIYRAISDPGWNFNNLGSGRVHSSYWIAFNVYEMLAFAGPSLAVLLFLGAVDLAAAARRREWSAINEWALAAIIFLLALDLSGKVCYEASRLAWFSFPLLAIAAGRAIPVPERDRYTVPAILLSLQVISTLIFRMVF